MTFQNVIEERALLKDFQSGDRIAFEKIFRLYNSALIFFANRLLISFEQIDAQEIVLDVFLKLNDKRTDFTTLQNIKAFLYISVKNSCLNAIEKEKVRLKRFDRYIHDFDETEQSVLSKIVQAEVLQELYTAIELLPEPYRIVMQKIIEGKSAKEISQELDIPVSTVNTQKSRAISQLKNNLSGVGIALLLLYF